MDDPEVRAKLVALHPIGQVGTPQDMAGSRSSWPRMNRRSPPAPISTSMAVSRYAESEGHERAFRVGVTRDFIRPNGELGFGGAGVRLLEQTPGIDVTFLPEHGSELRPEDIAGFDAGCSDRASPRRRSKATSA